MCSKLFHLSILLLSSLILSTCDDLTSFVYTGCSEGKYTEETPYGSNIDSLLSSLANAASISSYSKFTIGAGGGSAVSGLFQCRGDLPISDCTSCIHSAFSQLSALCPYATGGAVQLQGCYLRYGNDSFLGKPDTTLLYKKCGPDASASASSDLLHMRDSCFMTLSSSAAPPAGGMFRVGAAGYVQAMAQCVGDQSGKTCDNCITAAVGQLKAGCSVALSGEAYLGKCYARYSSSGVFASGYDHYHDQDHDHGHDNGKTVALIVGLMAGVALIIIFASFIRRAGNHGK